MYFDRQSQQFWFSPTDVTTFLGSRWVFAQTLAVARREREPWKEQSDGTAELARRRGDQHELAYLVELKAAGKSVAEIPRAKSAEQWEESVALTKAALADPETDVVIQAHLQLDGRWRGAADFLERNEQGEFEPVDTKLARGVKPYMVHQLCFYAEALQAIQGSLPKQLHLVLGDSRRQTLATNDFIHIARQTRAMLEEYVASDRPADEYPWPSQQLELSGLAVEAEKRWRADDHLLLVAGITRKQIERLEAAGIHTLTELAQADAADRPYELAAETWERLTRQARLQQAKTPTWELLTPVEGRGLALLAPPSHGDIFYDIEGDPLWDGDGSLEYLHGLWWLDAESGEGHFEAIWAHDRQQEKAAFERLIEIFIQRRIAHPGMHIYHYAPYEVTALKRLASRHGTCEEELDDLLRDEVFIDLYRVVRQSLQASVENYSIKSIESFYMDAREGEVKAGGDSVVEYERYRELAGSDEGQLILDAIRDYNEVDCHSTYLLREWLRERHREAVREFGWIQEPEPGRASEDALNISPMAGEPSGPMLHRTKLLLAKRRLELASAAATDQSEAQAIELLAELLLFNAREDKSAWWSFFDHREMVMDELIADGQAIGGLRELQREQGSGDQRTFEFPAQDHRVRRGDTLRDPFHGWEAGRVVDVNDKRNCLTITLGSNARSQPPTAVFPFQLIPKTPLDLALVSLADSLADGAASEFAAAKRFLRRKPPLHGEELSGGSSKELREQLADLEGSYMLVQGPPGSGKTFTAADLVVEQLILGKRVGVTAATHLAINTLCHEIEERAHERGHHFRGAKKDPSGGSSYESEHGLIESVLSNDQAAPGNYDLTAGTAWLFSRPEWREQLDLIVIDEAGQVSLAAALAVGTAAKTLLMVGDPNQLSQVVQGAHPDGAGASALEHAIGGHRTIPPTMGVFLPQSWRMTPQLCSFVSDTFYDGRLRPSEDAAKLDPVGTCALKYMPVCHSGNHQESIEETTEIAFEIDRLIREEGIDAKDVMVVTPYNLQVDRMVMDLALIEAGNGEDVRVLTVDKCQGQQAEVVFYSMAASGDVEVARGFEFLFSSNRFNVAISRARRAAYLVCSPELLACQVNSVEQLRLADAFVAFAQRAERAMIR